MSDEKPVSFVLMPADETPAGHSPQSYLEDMIRVLWRRRLLLFLGTALSGLAVFVYLALSPTVYRARATLIIQQPRFSTELKPESFSLEIYRTILLSDHMMSRLARVLKESRVIPDKWTPEKLESVLSVQVYVQAERESAGSRLYVPMLDLVAEYRNPEGAEKIVNAWAETFLNESAGLYGQMKESTLLFIEKQYPEIADELAEREGNLKSKQDYYSSVFVSLSDQWAERLMQAEFEVQAKELAYERESGDLLTKYVNETARLTREYEEETERLRLEFLTKWKPDLLEQELDLQKSKLATLQNELLDVQLEIKTSGDLLNRLKEQIDSQPQFLELSKAITDQALWDQVGKSSTSEVVERLRDMKLKSEVLNPAHQNLLDRLIATQINFDTLAPRKAHLEKEVVQIKADIDRLKQEITEKQIKLMSLMKDRELALTSLENERQTGLAVLSRERRIGREQIVKEGATRLERLTAKKDAAQDTLNRERDYEVGQLRREADSVRKTYGILAEKHVSAQLAKTEAGLDITLGAPAVAPQSAADTRIGLKTALALCVGFLIFAVFALASDYLSRLNRSASPTSEALPVPRLNYDKGSTPSVQREFAKH